MSKNGETYGSLFTIGITFFPVGMVFLPKTPIVSVPFLILGGIFLIISVANVNLWIDKYYRALFVMGMIFLPSGVVSLILKIIPFGITLITISLIFITVSLLNKSKWAEKI